MAQRLTPQRQEWIDYLVKRAYPRHRDGRRSVGHKEFQAELSDQPDQVLKSLFDSALKEELSRREVRDGASKKLG